MSTKRRLDQVLTSKGLVRTRSQAESIIKLGQVKVNDQTITKPGHMTSEDAEIALLTNEQYVSRAGLKLASVASSLGLDFTDKTVLDVGSSTGGFTEFALRHGATKVIAVEIGTDQLHPALHGDARIELHEKTDIRTFQTTTPINIVVADVSFVSLRDILPSIAALSSKKTQIVVMVKPQFEAHNDNLKHKGVIKNDKVRREILKNFEIWVRHSFVIENKSDSSVSGAKGNTERFYLLRKT